MKLYLPSSDVAIPEWNSRKRTAVQGDNGGDPLTTRKEGAPRRVDGMRPPRGPGGEAPYLPLPLRNGSPVRLFTMTFLPGGMSACFPDFGFLLLKK